MTRAFLERCALLPVLVLAVGAAGCENTVTMPEPDRFTQAYDVYSGPLEPGGRNFYLVTLDAELPVSITLAGAIVDNPLRSVSPVLTVEIGSWDGADCIPVESTETVPRLSAALQRVMGIGTHCIAVSDKRGMAQTVGVVLRVVAPPVLATGDQPGSGSFSSTITPGGRATRSFNASTSGIAAVTLSSVSPSNAVTGIGIGLQDPKGGGCLLAQVTTARPGGSPQLTLPLEAGFYCAALFDVGNFTGNQTFTLSVTHP